MLRKIIQEKYKDRIPELTERLCKNCKKKQDIYAVCNLLPITLDGKECPYFIQGEKNVQKETKA